MAVIFCQALWCGVWRDDEESADRWRSGWVSSSLTAWGTTGGFYRRSAFCLQIILCGRGESVAMVWRRVRRLRSISWRVTVFLSGWGL